MESQSTHKVVIVGDSGVGKSCLARCLSGKDFDPESKPTIGINIETATVQLNPDTTVKLTLWDIAGQERYRAPTPYYSNAASVIVIYDVSSRRSYENVALWLGEVRDHAASDIALLLVGNKSDLGDRRIITHAEGDTLASKNGMAFIETSSLGGLSIDKILAPLLKR